MSNYAKATEKYEKSRAGNAPKAEDPDQVQAAKHLQKFLKSGEGKDALRMLAASGRHIIIAEEEPEGGRTTVYILHKEGLMRSDERSGSGLAYSTAADRSKPMLAPITPPEAVLSATRLRNRPAADFMDWLRKELDQIADRA